MLAEQVERPGRHEVDAVVHLADGGARRVVEPVLARDEPAVEAVAQREDGEHDDGEERQAHGAPVYLAAPVSQLPKPRGLKSF